MSSSILIKKILHKGERKDILIVGNRIKTIADSIEYNAEIVIDGSDRAVIPGFINMHTHSAMTLMRGLSEDSTLMDWLDEIWRVEAHLDDESIYWGSKLAALEMIKSGTTCFLDMYWSPEATVRAVDEMGLRARITYVLLDAFDTEKAALQRKECEAMYRRSNEWCDRVDFGVSVHADYTVSEESMKWAAAFTKEHGLTLNTHIGETKKEMEDDLRKRGMSTVEYFDKCGLLSDRTVAAHCIWLSPKEMEIMGERGVTAVHNINSNLKLASGNAFPYYELKNAGVNVCLGTDGAASSNNLDMLETAKTTSLNQKALRCDPKAITLNESLDSITAAGARALNLDCGRVEEGALADILLVNTKSLAFIPDFNFLSNLFFSAHSDCIDTVICDGRILMEGRKVAGEDEIIAQANKYAWELYKKANK